MCGGVSISDFHYSAWGVSRGKKSPTQAQGDTHGTLVLEAGRNAAQLESTGHIQLPWTFYVCPFMYDTLTTASTQQMAWGGIGPQYHWGFPKTNTPKLTAKWGGFNHVSWTPHSQATLCLSSQGRHNSLA